MSPLSPSPSDGAPSEKFTPPPPLADEFIVNMLLLRLIVTPVPAFIRRSVPSKSPSPSMSANAGGDVMYPIVSHI